MTAINENRQLHGTRAPHVVESVECCADCAPGEQHVIDQNHEGVINAFRRNLGR